ncbi:MAG: hypothetical protein J1E98_01930 [Lachnospiraceae bacterium]|nr:hypothetical protein [Lachnospiraceae bacterium]
MPLTGEKDLQQLKKRILELADKSYTRGIYTYTPFLGLSEQQVFYAVEREVSYAGYSMNGGSPMCERKIVRFGSPDNLGYDEPFPITHIEIRPSTPKFAEHLTHRDFLGALMNLGIERSTIGDIFVRGKEQGAILFCHENIADYIIDNLNQVKHTNVICRIPEGEAMLEMPEPRTESLTVASLRIDAVVAKIYNISRNSSQDLFCSGKIFVNGILVENTSYQLKKDDAVTVRGYGKFLYYGQSGVSKKGKDRVEVGIFA